MYVLNIFSCIYHFFNERVDEESLVAEMRRKFIDDEMQEDEKKKR